MLTFGAGPAAVARQQHGALALGFRTVLFDVLAVDFSKHFAPASLLLPNRRRKAIEPDLFSTVSTARLIDFIFSRLSEDIQYMIDWPRGDIGFYSGLQNLRGIILVVEKSQKSCNSATFLWF